MTVRETEEDVEARLAAERLGIPFLVYSGHGRTSDAPPAFQNVARIVKPVPTESLLRAIRAALA